ncbi:MAG: hypothetical protein HXX20_22855 [Chloroflexi bacterium]|nr:hypothetical protein [Chloroflexota bacterium]
MSIILERVLSEIKELSFEELLTLQKQIIDEVRTKAAPIEATLSTPTKPSLRPLNIPEAYRRKPEEVEALLVAVFGSEQLAVLEKVDLSNLPPGSKTVTEMISEDREERF